MPKTEVILLENIVGLGGESDQVKVAAGYARNYLFPQRLAIPLTAANKKRIEALQKRRGEREAHEYNTMSDLSKSLAKLVCLVKVKTGDDGKMFGSVTPGTIADELKHQFDIVLDKRKIHLEHPIRALGEYDVEMRLHAQVTNTLKVKVESSTPLPQPAESATAKAGAPEAAPGKEGAPIRTEKRGRRFEVRPGAEAKSERAERPTQSERPARMERPLKGERALRPERQPRPDRPAKVEKPAPAQKPEPPK